MTFQTIRAALGRRERRCVHREGLVEAAVLIPMFELAGQVQVLFTLRTHTVRHHKGQVSFPGGARNVEDCDLAETALRETWEEVGIAPEQVEILGALDDMRTISDFRVTPYVGRIPWPCALQPNPAEIAEVFHVSLETLLDPARCRIEERVNAGRRFYPVYHFEGGKHDVWGVTGYILSHFLEVAFQWEHPELERERMTPRSEWL